jgi:polysaccharide biosynthesis PFTS motif protein
VVKEFELNMILKRKRDIGSLLNTRYKRVVDKLTASDHFMLVNMDTAAHELINASKMVISLPFTSTALIAREMGKPSCFYDPLGLVQQDDKAAHGIKIVTGPEELRAWILSVLNTDVPQQQKN